MEQFAPSTHTPKKLSIEIILLAGFLLILLIILNTSITAYQNISTSIETNRWVAHTQEVLTHLEKLRANIWIEANAYRNYSQVTTPTEFNKQFAQTDLTIKQETEILHLLTRDNNARQQSLNQLAALLSQLQSVGGKIADQSTKPTDTIQWITLIDQISAIINSIEIDENRLMQQRVAAVHAKNLQVYLSIFIAFLLQFAICRRRQRLRYPHVRSERQNNHLE